MPYETIEHIDDRVAIARRPPGKSFYACFTDNAGRQQMRSLRISNIKEARRKARQLAESLNDDTHSREEEVRGSKHVTFRQAVDHYMEGCKGTEKSIYETRLRLNFICGDLDGQRRYPREAWGNRRIQTIKTKDIENWMRYEKKPGQWKDSTEHQYLNAIKQVMKHAAKQNWVVQSEAVAVAKPRITDEKIPEALDDEVVQPLFALLPTYAMYIMSLLLETGLRSGELYNLRWREVDTTGEAPVLTVVKSKSKRFRVVPLTDVAIRIIDHLRGGSSFYKMDSPIRFDNGYAKLTVAQRGQLLSDITKLTCKCFNKTQPGARQYCSACKAIVARYDITYAHAKKLWKNRDKERPTIIWPSDDNKDAFIIPRINIYKSLRKAAAELGITEFHPHQMRHTWATRLLEEGINEFELMQLGGWSTIAMVRRYAKVNVVKLSPKIRKALANRPSGEVRTDLPELRIA